MENKLKIGTSFLFISSRDIAGGANIAAYRIHKALIEQGYKSKMIVNHKLSNDDSVIEIESYSKIIIKNLMEGQWNFPFSYSLGLVIKKLKDWFYKTLTYNGAETFFYPESKYILKMINYKPDIIQLHNIREFFDIRVLKSWSEHSKIFFRVCDLWLFTGHCALPLDCDKYITGCGHCPDLSLIPKVRGDKTRENLTFKKKQILDLPINFIYPSKWVEKKMSRLRLNEKSSTKVIENSVDLNKFIPNKSEISRSELGLDKSDIILLAISSGDENCYKDITTTINAFHKIEKEFKNLKLIIIGAGSLSNQLSSSKNIILKGKIYNQDDLIMYYNCSDIFIHSANVETWCLTVTEARAMGLPIIASDVGGIPEQIHQNVEMDAANNTKGNGLLFERNNVDELVSHIRFLVQNKSIRKQMGYNSRKGIEHYGIDNFVEKSIKFYEENL